MIQCLRVAPAACWHRCLAASCRPSDRTSGMVKMSPTQQLHLALNALPGVEQTRSRFGSPDRPAWCVRGREFAHLHADDLIDLRLPRSVQARLADEPLAHFRASKSEWVELEFHTPEDVERVIALAHEAWVAARDAKK